jgi:L-asparaginase II
VLDYINQTFLIYMLKFALRESDRMVYNMLENMKKPMDKETCKADSFIASLDSTLKSYSEGLYRLYVTQGFQQKEDQALKRLEAALNAQQQYVNYEREIRDKFITLMLGTDTQNRGGRKR